MEPKNDVRQGLSVPKAAEVMGVCEQTVRNLYHRRELEGYQVGRKLLIFADSIVAYQAKHSNQPPVAQTEEQRRLFVPPTPPRRRRRSVPDYERHNPRFRSEGNE
jgi:excisionase family DNA binding protein